MAGARAGVAGGEVRSRSSAGRLLRRPDPEEPTPEVAHEARKARSTLTKEQRANAARESRIERRPRRKRSTRLSGTAF